MAVSGTTNFNPSLGEIVLFCYNRCGIRNTALVQEHMEAARMAANMVCADFSNQGVNLWQVGLVSQPLTAGTATYSVDPSVVVILDAYVSVNNGTQTIDRIIMPVSRTEYASYANKSQPGFPTTFWHDRLLAPTVSLWPVPTAAQNTLNYYVVRQIMDANYTNGQNVDVPYLWLKAFADALSVELAVIWAPQALVYLVPMAAKSYEVAASTNVELAQQYVSPMTSSYWRA